MRCVSSLESIAGQGVPGGLRGILSGPEGHARGRQDLVPPVRTGMFPASASLLCSRIKPPSTDYYYSPGHPDDRRRPPCPALSVPDLGGSRRRPGFHATHVFPSPQAVTTVGVVVVQSGTIKSPLRSWKNNNNSPNPVDPCHPTT